jgi:hypothetical protein
MDKTTIPLKTPIEHNGQRFTEITILRRPKTKDVLRSRKGKSDEEAQLALISNLTEIAPEVFQEMDYADYVRVAEAVAGFLS